MIIVKQYKHLIFISRVGSHLQSGQLSSLRYLFPEYLFLPIVGPVEQYPLEDLEAQVNSAPLSSFHIWSELINSIFGVN